MDEHKVYRIASRIAGLKLKKTRPAQKVHTHRGREKHEPAGYTVVDSRGKAWAGQS